MKKIKWANILLSTICVVIFGAVLQSCDEAVTPVSMAPVGEVVSTTEKPDDPIAGKSMILVQAFDAVTKRTYTFDANDPEDRYLLVPSTVRSGHMMQGLEQIAPVKREFIDQFFEVGTSIHEQMIGADYMVTDEKGNRLQFREWHGAPLYPESDRRPEKGASVAAGILACYYDWECTEICAQQPQGPPACYLDCRRVRKCMIIPDPYWP